MTEIPFKEVQRLTDSWLGKIIGAIIFYLTGIQLGQLVGDPSWSSLLGVLILGSSLLLFLGAKLKTRIDREGVTYQFSPFHSTPRFLAWTVIQGSTVRRYSPIREYGGWGIKIGRNGLALNTAGCYGLQLVLENGKQILIGTQKKADLEETIRSLKAQRT